MTAHHAAPAVHLGVLVVVNDPDSGPGRFGEGLGAHGLRVTVVAGDEVPDSPLGHDAVLLLGGGFMPDADVRAPWLPQERRLTAAALEQGVPLLGICLGAQLLALVAGGSVRADHGRPERGLVTVSCRPEAREDPLFARMPDRFPALQNHRDAVTALPLGAVHLARTDDCPIQAFRVGECAWGLQFHPEAGAERLRRWDPARVAADGFDLAALTAQAALDEPASAAAARILLDGFVAAVRARGPGGP